MSGARVEWEHNGDVRMSMGVVKKQRTKGKERVQGLTGIVFFFTRRITHKGEAQHHYDTADYNNCIRTIISTTKDASQSTKEEEHGE